MAKGLQNVGMVCDAIWTDFDNDNWIDLIVVGEWMPVTFYRNNKGRFENVTAQSGVGDQIGWWNSVAAGDFDNDGDIDFIVGNLGQNSFLRATDKQPVSIYAKDFDNNGSIDPIVTLFLKDKSGVRREYTAMNRDDIVSQLPSVRKRFLTYKEFANADIQQIFPDDEMKGAIEVRANNFRSCLLINNGHGKFKLKPLPDMAQMAPINGMVVDDFDADGNLDVMINGNDYGNEVFNGRYDAMNGLLLLGNGAGQFTAQTILQSGFFTPGDAKALIKLRGAYDGYLLAASQNRGPLKIFKARATQKTIPLQPSDKAVYIKLANGKTRKEELYFGNSFLSQSGRFLKINNSLAAIEVEDNKGRKRQLSLR